jgi:hypothetical protein
MAAWKVVDLDISEVEQSEDLMVKMMEVELVAT